MSEVHVAAADWLGSLAGFGLPDTAEVGTLPGSVAELLHEVSRHKLLGVLAGAVAEEAVRLPVDHTRALALAHEGAMREVLLLEEMLLEAIGVLSDAGVDSRVLKGAALAHMVHRDPAERCFGDNDVLVGAAQMDVAVEALVRAGAVRSTPALSAAYDRRFAKSVTLRWTGPSELDLHRTLAAGPYGLLIDLGDLARDPAEVLLAGRSVLTLPADMHLLHGAIHVALGDVDARLGNVRDLALLAQRPSLDVEMVIETAIRWKCAAPVAIGLRSTRRLGHRLSPIEEWAHTYEIGELDRSRLGAYRQRDGRFRRQAIASWKVLGWRDRASFTRALLAPSAANRAARGLPVRSPVRRFRSG